MINSELPFRYPPALYAQKVQGNVTLRLRVDTNGLVRPDSTRDRGIERVSGARLRRGEGRRRSCASCRPSSHGEPMAVTILFPVYFRHPDARPLPGDTILNRRDSTPPSHP